MSNVLLWDFLSEETANDLQGRVLGTGNGGLNGCKARSRIKAGYQLAPKNPED